MHGMQKTCAVVPFLECLSVERAGNLCRRLDQSGVGDDTDMQGGLRR
jgi:hypothetical protein